LKVSPILPPQHPALGKHSRNHSRIKPSADFRFPDLRGDHPLRARPAPLAPTCPVIDRPRICIVQRLKPRLTMLFDKEPHLLNRLPDFGGFRSAAMLNPLLKSPCRSRRCFAFLPGRDV
jgi:hypothetical protein